jgi:hypothetical protein
MTSCGRRKKRSLATWLDGGKGGDRKQGICDQVDHDQVTNHAHGLGGYFTARRVLCDFLLSTLHGWQIVSLRH